MLNRFKRSSLTRPLLTVLAVAGAGLGACGAASSEDPAAGQAEGAGDALSDTTEGASLSASASTTGQNLFHAPQPWTKDVSGLPRSDKSDRIMGWLSDHGGWGT